MAPEINKLINNRYEIRSILGQGGMGAVYRAWDQHLNIEVAIKENLFLTREYSEQFQREACILAALRHANLPHVIDYFSLDSNIQYLVMDYIEGEDLRERMERMGSLPEREVILIGISICDALHYMHTRKEPVVHRDIKPGNIKVTPERQAVLVDFGLAKIIQGGQVTSTGARAMTPGYSPPEQYGHARTDARSDIYSLGATLYAALTGVIPEDGLARMAGKADLTPIRELVGKVNRRLAEVIETAMEVEPEDRFQTAEDFRRGLIESGDLAAYYQERPTITPPPVTASEQKENEADKKNDKRPRDRLSRRRRQRNRMVWGTVPLFALLLAFAYIFIYVLRPDLVNSALAYLRGEPTIPTQPTILASVMTTQPSPPAGQVLPTTTLDPGALLLVGANTETPTVEPTPTITPTATETPLPTPTLRGGGMGQIAFSSNRTGIYQIWLTNADGKQAPRQITNEADGACQPAWEPTGMRLAYISPCAGKQDVYKGSNIYIIQLDADGKAVDKTQLTSSLEGDFDPAWSPDGNRIAFTSLRNGKSSIWIIDLRDNSTVDVSRQTRNPDKHPAWAPSGMQLAFVRQFITSQIWVMSDNGQSQDMFSISGPVNNIWPAWSVDGQVLFYSQSSPDSTVPILIYKRYEDRKSTIETRIPANPGKNDGPFAQVNPSPDGFWLAYESWPDGENHDIYIMNVNGSNAQRLTTDPGFDFGPTWRPLPGSALP